MSPPDLPPPPAITRPASGPGARPEVPASPAPWQGAWPRLGRLVLEGDLQDHEVAALEAALPLSRGQALTPEALRRVVRAAFATGRFQEVQARQVPQGEGVELHLWVSKQAVVVGWQVEGNHHLSSEAIARALDLQWGQPLAPEGFKAWPKLLAERYVREGYPQARLLPQADGAWVALEREPGRPERVRLRLRLEEGPPVTVGQLKVLVAARRPSAVGLEGASLRPAVGTWADEPEQDAVRRLVGQVHRQLGWTPGAVLSRDRFFGGLEAADRLLGAAGFTNSRASFTLSRPGVSPTANFGAVVGQGAGPVDLTLALELGPRALVSVEGPWLWSEAELAGVITIHKNRSTSLHELELSREGLLRLYAEHGFPEAKVTHRLLRLPNEVDWVRFQVDPGPQRLVGAVRVEGAKAIPEDTLRSWMAIRPVAWQGGGAFEPGLWAQDLGAIKAQYLALGFPQAQVQELPRQALAGGLMGLGLRVEEGPRRLVMRLLLEGARATDEAGLLQSLGVEPGDPFLPTTLAEAVAGAKAYYAKVGYPLAAAEARYEEGASQPGLLPGTLSLKVTPGPLKRLGGVLVRGNLLTQDQVVARQVLLERGTPYNAEQLLATQQAIYQLGFFDRVRVVPARPITDDPKDPVDLLVEVHERESGFLALGGGFSDLGWVGAQLSGEYTQLNWQGQGIPVRTEAIYSAPKSALNFSIRDPYLWGSPWVGEAAFNAVRERASSSLVSQRYGPSLGLSRQLSPTLTGSLRYGWSRIDYPEASPLDLLALGGVPNRIDSNVSLGLVHDSRSDLFNPRYGTKADFSADFATPLLNGTLRYLRPRLSLAHFIPLRPWRLVTLGLGLDANLIVPVFGTPALPDDLRFQLGGANSLRGYDQRQVGRPTASAPTGVVAPGFGTVAPGGELAMVGHMELRYPLPWVEGLGGVAFLDAGNVWASPGELLRGQLKANGGLGLRYATPIGPVRLDWAARMWPELQALGGVYVGLGQAF